jgi:hypothetical protein
LIPLLNIFKYFLNYSINIFMLRQITLNNITQFFIYIYFFFTPVLDLYCHILFLMYNMRISVVAVKISIFSNIMLCSQLTFDRLSDVIFQKRKLILHFQHNMANKITKPKTPVRLSPLRCLRLTLHKRVFEFACVSLIQYPL